MPKALGLDTFKTWRSRSPVAPAIELGHLEEARAQAQVQPQPEVAANVIDNYKNNDTNPTVIAITTHLVTLAAILILSLINYRLDREDNTGLWMLFLKDFAIPSLVMFGVPGFVYARNRDLRNYVLNELLDQVTKRLESLHDLVDRRNFKTFLAVSQAENRIENEINAFSCRQFPVS